MQHPHGTFCFAELHAHDMARARQFYGAVFGWTARDAPDAPASPSLLQLDGCDVVGLRQAQGPARWVPYIAVDNADASTARAVELRAGVISAPQDIPGFARIAIVQDPAGGVVGLREAKGHPGAAVLDEPGSLWWAELLTRDIPSAKAFYTSLLGWNPVDTLKYGIRYSVFKLGDQAVAGLLPIGADWGPVSPYWQVLFAVADCDAAVERAKQARGALVFGPNDVQNAGRAAVLTDPGGAMFVVMQPNEQ